MAGNCYRIVVGEVGNEIGHIKECSAQTEIGAKRQLTQALSRYKGDGWGYIEKKIEGSMGDFWERIR